MNTDTQAQAPESYATFWEPVATGAPSSPPVLTAPADAKDAYQEFVNVTEEVPGAPRAEHP
jgi:hypothetical protein